jgi:hypothetical protein
MQPEALAARTVGRAGGAYLPRIIQRKPRPGDVHPLPSNILPRFLSWLPLAYLHDLRQIELSHHFRQVFRGRRSKGSRETEEILACVYGDRLWRDIRHRLRERRKRAGGPMSGSS